MLPFEFTCNNLLIIYIMINKHSVFIRLLLLYNIVTKTVELGTTVQVDENLTEGGGVIIKSWIILLYHLYLTIWNTRADCKLYII